MGKFLQPAKQDRSRETQNRILRATERLLKTELFESISIRRIVEEAETSIGSFYARFSDKNALLPVLYQQYEDQLAVQVSDLETALENADSLEEVSRHAAAHFVNSWGKTPNLSRALYEYVTCSREAASATGLLRRNQYSFLINAILRFGDQIQHVDPDRAAELGLYFMVVVCRNRLLYPTAPHTQLLKISKRELKIELEKLLCGYLRGG